MGGERWDEFDVKPDSAEDAEMVFRKAEVRPLF